MSTPANLSEIARHLFISRERVRQLVSEGVLVRQADGFDLDDCRRRYIERLRDHRPQSDAAEAVRLARAREIEIRTAERLRKLVDVDEVEATFVEIVGGLVSDLLAVPARCTRDLDMREKIEAEIDAVRNRAADRFEKKAAELRGRHPREAA